MASSAQKPRVLVFTTAYKPFVGGAEIAVEQIAKKLKDHFEFFIITSRMRRDLPKREVSEEGEILRLGFGCRLDKFWLLVFGWLAVVKAFKPKRQKTVFWVIDFSFGAAPAGFLKMLYPKIPLIFTMQYGESEERILKGRFGLMKSAFKLILGKADYVTAISGYLMRLCEEYGYIGERAVIPNGVDINQFQNQNLTDRNRRRVIITVSRLVRKNGVDILIKAAAKLKKEFPDAELHIIGSGQERTNLENLAGELGIKDGVKFLGEIAYEKVPGYLADADIFARPSRSEGMGNAFIEALAAGIPIIGTPVGGITDIIKDRETGLFAKVDDPEDLAGKMKCLLQDAGLASRIAENGRKMVEERFDWDKISEAYGAAFQKQFAKRKRILIATGLFPPDIGGPATYSKILLTELPGKNIGIRVLSFGSVRRIPKLFRHFCYFWKVFCMGKSADVIFAQDPVSVGLFAAIAAKLLRKRFLLKIVGDYAWEQGAQRFGVKEFLDEFLKNRYGWRIEFLRKIEKFTANRADKIIVPSEYLKKIVIAWGIPAGKIQVIYNAFDAPDLGISKDEARRELGLGREEKVIVSAGRDVPWKGFKILREIMPEISGNFSSAKLFILTNEPHKNVLNYLAAADIFVLNTAYEGLSHQLLEAMAAGCPIVTTDVGGNPELIQDGESGFLVKFNDKRALSDRILKLLSDEKLAEKFGKGAQKKAQEFSLARMIDETAKVLFYESV